MEQEEKLSLDFGNGEIYEVWLEVATYPADKNIKVCVFTEKEEEIWKLFELTTEMGIPLETAVACATKNPAISLGIYEERGSISIGKKADILLLDQNLTLKKVIKSGR